MCASVRACWSRTRRSRAVVARYASMHRTEVHAPHVRHTDNRHMPMKRLRARHIHAIPTTATHHVNHVCTTDQASFMRLAHNTFDRYRHPVLSLTLVARPDLNSLRAAPSAAPHVSGCVASSLSVPCTPCSPLRMPPTRSVRRQADCRARSNPTSHNGHPRRLHPTTAHGSMQATHPFQPVNLSCGAQGRRNHPARRAPCAPEPTAPCLHQPNHTLPNPTSPSRSTMM